MAHVVMKYEKYKKQSGDVESSLEGGRLRCRGSKWSDCKNEEGMDVVVAGTECNVHFWEKAM